MAPALVDLVEGSREVVERSFARLIDRVSSSYLLHGAFNANPNKRTPAPLKGLSDVDALVGRRHWVRAGLSDSGTSIPGHLGAIIVTASTGTRPRDASNTLLTTNLNTNRTSGGVPVSTAVLAAILSATISVALCVAFYKYGYSLFRACRTRIFINAPRGSNSKPADSKKFSLRSSRVLTLPANPFQANPIQPRIQEGSYDSLPPIPDPSAWMRLMSYPLNFQYQAREAEAYENDIEDDMASHAIDIKTPLLVKTHSPLQFSVSSDSTVYDIQHGVPSVKRLNSDHHIPQMKPAAIAPNAREVTDAQHPPPRASRREPVSKFEELAEPEGRYPSKRDDLPHRQSQGHRQSALSPPRTPPRPRFSQSSLESFLIYNDDSAETGQELNVSGFQYDVPNRPRRHTSLPWNQEYQVSESMTSLDNNTSSCPPISPSLTEQLANALFEWKDDPINPLPPPYLVKVVHTFQPSFSDEMEVDPGEMLSLLRIFTDGWCLVRRFDFPTVGSEGSGEMEQIGVVPILCLASTDDVRSFRTRSGTMSTTSLQNAAQPGSSSQEKSGVSPPDYSDSEYSRSETGTRNSNLGSDVHWSTDFISFSPVPSLNFDVSSFAGSKGSTLTKGPLTIGKIQTHRGLIGRPAAVPRRPMAPMHSRSRSFHTLINKTCLS